MLYFLKKKNFFAAENIADVDGGIGDGVGGMDIDRGTGGIDEGKGEAHGTMVGGPQRSLLPEIRRGSQWQQMKQKFSHFNSFLGSTY